MRYLMISGLMFFHFNVYAEADPFLPEEVCKTAGAANSECTEESLNAVFADLNDDGTKELIVYYGGGSCGAQYFVFKINSKIKWELMGNWCGCDHGKPKIRKTTHNGYKDIFTCGESGIFNGREYVGVRQ